MDRFESLVEQQIRQAQERGEFKDLPGLGRPLPGKGQPDDDLWWVRGLVRREGLSGAVALPPGLRLAREVERLTERVAEFPSAQAVREAARRLNQEIAEFRRAPAGPPVRLSPVDVAALVATWRAARLR